MRNSGLKNRTRWGIAIPVVSSLFFVLVLLSTAGASSWEPKDVVRSFLIANYPWPEIDVSEVHLNGAKPQQAPVKIFLEKGPLPGRATFRFEFRGAHSVTLSAMVRVYDRVVMSRRALGRGAVLSNDDLFETLAELTRIPLNALHDRGRAEGKPLLRSLLPNMPITEDMIDSGTTLRRGTKITLLFESPGFTVRTMGELRQNGTVGEYVEVVNTVSKKVLTGMLVDASTVKVGF